MLVKTVVALGFSVELGVDEGVGFVVGSIVGWLLGLGVGLACCGVEVGLSVDGWVGCAVG